MNVLTIDCGTSYLKMAILDEKGQIVNDLSEKCNSLTDKLATINKFIKQVAKSGYKDVTVAISTEMHGFILVNINGEELTDYYSWTYTCKDSTIKELDSKVKTDWIKNTGMKLKPGIASTSMYDVVNRDNIKLSSAVFLTLGDYIIYKITGIFPHIHPTYAAASGLYSLETKDWNYKYIECLGFSDVQFLPIAENEIINCEINGCCFHFCEAVGDQQAALLGANITPKALSINMGTGSQISVISEELMLSDVYQTRPFFSGKYLLTIPHIPCGRALAVIYGLFGDLLIKYTGEESIDENKLWSILMNSCEKKDYNGDDVNALSIDMSFFDNAVSNSNRGNINNIGEDNFKISNLSKAIRDCMSENYNKMAQSLPVNMRAMERIIFTGGVARKNSMLREAIAEKIGIGEVDVVEDETIVGLRKWAEESMIK